MSYSSVGQPKKNKLHRPGIEPGQKEHKNTSGYTVWEASPGAESVGVMRRGRDMEVTPSAASEGDE